MLSDTMMVAAAAEAATLRRSEGRPGEPCTTSLQTSVVVLGLKGSDRIALLAACCTLHRCVDYCQFPAGMRRAK